MYSMKSFMVLPFFMHFSESICFFQIVDLCCGANDCSQLMKEKLDAVGKKCLFKNYDVIQPKVALALCSFVTAVCLIYLISPASFTYVCSFF